ncbi:MAG: HAD family hydrolase [Lachnospiraceae bacterium]
MRKPEAVVFDMDGVIFDSEICVIKSWEIVAKRHGIKDIESACRACLGLNGAASERVMHERYGEDFPYKIYNKEMSDIYHENYDNGRLPMKPGVVELLEFLKDNGYKVALASSTRSAVVTKELADAGIIQYFDKIVCGDMVNNSKPAPDIFLKACELLGVKPENAMGIEDSFNGIRSAYAAGMQVIMVPDLVPPDDEMGEKADFVMNSLTEVQNYLADF